jgi:hypothetical protein
MGIVPSDQTDREGKFWIGRLTWGKYAICARKEADGYRDNGRYFDHAVGRQFTALVPADPDLELEIRAPGCQLWRFSVSGGRRGKPFRNKSGEKRAFNIQLRPDLR